MVDQGAWEVVGRQRRSVGAPRQSCSCSRRRRRSYDQRRIVRWWTCRQLQGWRIHAWWSVEGWSSTRVWVTGSRGISRRHTCLRSPKSRGKPFLDVAWFLVLAGIAKGQFCGTREHYTGGHRTAIPPAVLHRRRQSSMLSALPDDWRDSPPLFAP